MKQKDPTRVERRRRLVELNLLGDRRPRVPVSKAGCLSFLSRSALAVAAVLAVASHHAGIH